MAIVDVENLWDDVLYPQFRATIRGEQYGYIARENIDEQCYYIACRAISAFKFPKIALDYTTIYANRNEDDELVIVSADDEYAIPHGYFTNTLSANEINVILAWMKYYWCEDLISNADSFEDMYTDSNVKTYSRANNLAQTMKLAEMYRNYAKETENTYSRVNSTHTPSLGDVNEDE